MATTVTDKSIKADKMLGVGDSSSPFDWLFALPPAQFALLAVVIGLLLTEGLNADEQNSLGNFFSVVGQTLTAVAGQALFIQGITAQVDTDSTAINPEGGEISAQLIEMEKRIVELEGKLNIK